MERSRLVQLHVSAPVSTRTCSPAEPKFAQSGCAEPAERHETPDPVRSDAVEARFQCVLGDAARVTAREAVARVSGNGHVVVPVGVRGPVDGLGVAGSHGERSADDPRSRSA
jgi:hypothetical protein